MSRFDFVDDQQQQAHNDYDEQDCTDSEESLMSVHVVNVNDVYVKKERNKKERKKDYNDDDEDKNSNFLTIFVEFNAADVLWEDILNISHVKWNERNFMKEEVELSEWTHEYSQIKHQYSHLDETLNFDINWKNKLVQNVEFMLLWKTAESLNHSLTYFEMQICQTAELVIQNLENAFNLLM